MEHWIEPQTDLNSPLPGWWPPPITILLIFYVFGGMKMTVFKRLKVGFLALFMMGTSALCQPLLFKVSADENPPEPPPPEFRVLRIYPKAAPSPALLYRLDPEIRHQEPGNSVQSYYRAFSPEWQSFKTRDKDYWKKEEEWLKLPLEKLPPEADMRKSSYLKQIELGTNKSYTDWDMVSGLKRDAIFFLLPDIQGMRNFARDLTLKARFELKEKEYGQAVKTMRTTVTLGRHVANGPTLIQSLVGIAIISIGFKQIEEGIQQKEFPNLYWALAKLQQGPIDLNSAMDGERLFIESLLPGLRDQLYSKNPIPVGQPELQSMLDRFRTAMNAEKPVASSNMEKIMEKAATSVMLAVGLPSAKAKLLAFGLESKILENLPPLQVVLMAEVLIYDENFDSVSKWIHSPYWVAKPEMEKTLIKSGVAPPPKGTPISPLPIGFLSRFLQPAIIKVMQAKVRQQRNLAQLMVVEAIRMHAAQTGKLPQSLDQVKVVPVPANPVTGKPFGYSLVGNHAMLESEPIHDSDAKELRRWRLELATPEPK